MSDPGGDIRSVLGLITAASGRSPERLLYRTLVGPKHLAEVVQKVELITAVKETLPENMKDVAEEAKEILIRGLISTTSVKGHMLSMLTTNKSEIRVNDPRVRKSVLGGLLRSGGSQGGGGFDDYN